MTQPEALRLADALDELDRQFSRNGLCGDAAAELRQLHAQHDALLEAFSLLRVECHQLHHNFKDRHTMLEPCPVVARINAAIKKAGGNT